MAIVSIIIIIIYFISEQLKQFPSTRKILKKVLEKVKEEQTEYINKAQKTTFSITFNILDHNNKTIVDDLDKQEETIASVTELFLEYLRYSSPPILDRKENNHEYTEV